jgi:kinesin family protein 11
MSAWSDKSREIVSGVTKSRDNVKTKIKADFAAANLHTTSLRTTTTSVHDTTVKIVEAQMANMDSQLHSLDDIVTRIRAQNNDHHTAHTSSLSALSSTVQSSYSSIGEHFSTSFTRVQSLESDMSAQTTALKLTLPTLAPAAEIRAPLSDLRETITSQNLIEYNPTGSTPQRISYTIPTTLPRTEAHEVLLARLRDPSSSFASSVDDASRSPSKGMVFNDATQSTTTSPPTVPTPTLAIKPLFPRSATVPQTSTSSLRELDINILAQETTQTQLSSPTDLIQQPPLKKQNTTKDDAAGSKLPMKKMGRKTVTTAGLVDRENLTITNFSASVGPGGREGRRLRSSREG